MQDKDADKEPAQALPLNKARVTRLSDRDRDIFLKLIEADAEPNEALKAAVERYKKRRAGA